MRKRNLTDEDRRILAEIEKWREEGKKYPPITELNPKHQDPIGIDFWGNKYPTSDDDRRRDPRQRKPLFEHASGALLGLSVGDALGTTLEFTRPTGVPAYPTLMTGPHREITGGGPHHVAEGQITDDTQMAACLSEVLRDRGKKTTAKDLAKHYREWLPVAFDVGNQTRAALQLAETLDPEEAGRKVWLDSGRHAAGNGSLMRTAPIALYYARNQVARCELSALDSRVTHWDPRCQLACVAFNGAISSAVRGDTSVRDMVLTAEEDLGYWATFLALEYPEEKLHVEAAASALEEDLALATKDDPRLYEPGLHLVDTQGFVRVAFRLAFWHLHHSNDLVTALIDVVNRGGDADTNGAIVGALLGARFGHDAVPLPWKQTVLGAMPKQGKKSLLWKRFHPLHLVGTAHELLGHEL